MTQPIQLRVAAAQATLDAFRGRPFAWGKADCVRLAAFAARRLGHRPRLLKAGSYASLKGALRALARAGHADLNAAVDAQLFPRIASAAALPGDLVALPADEDGPWVALTVALGNGRVLGFHGSTGCCEVLQPAAYLHAWRVEPCRTS